MKSTIRFIGIAVLLCLPACEQILGPRTFEDCALQEMREARNNKEVEAIAQLCRKKFPERTIDDLSLPFPVINAITGKAEVNIYRRDLPGFDRHISNDFSGNFYNGDRSWVVTQVTVSITPKAKKGEPISIPVREYNIDVNIPPLTSADFKIKVNPDPYIEYDWMIERGRGYYARLRD